jgi:hypothetical protein
LTQDEELDLYLLARKNGLPEAEASRIASLSRKLSFERAEMALEMYVTQERVA